MGALQVCSACVPVFSVVPGSVASSSVLEEVSSQTLFIFSVPFMIF